MAPILVHREISWHVSSGLRRRDHHSDEDNWTSLTESTANKPPPPRTRRKPPPAPSAPAPAPSSSADSQDKKKKSIFKSTTTVPTTASQTKPSPSSSFSHSVLPQVLDPGVLDDVIPRLLEVRKRIKQLCSASRQIFYRQPNLLELEEPIKICDGILGQCTDLLRLFKYGGFPPATNYLFLGAFCDYGKQTIETICHVYKIKYSDNAFFMRGRYEYADMNLIKGSYDECKRQYNVRIWKIFLDCFNYLPPAAAAMVGDKILHLNGSRGISLNDRTTEDNQEIEN